MADFTELEWRRKFRPKLNPSTGADCYVPGEESEILKEDEHHIWTEIWDWDAGTPLMVSSFISEEGGAIAWYFCEIPWPGDDILTADKSED